MKTNILTFLCFVFLCACQAPPVEEYAIIPQPQEITYTPGFFKMGNHPVISYSGDLNNEAGLLQKILSSDFSLSATVKDTGKGDINLVLDPAVLPDKPEGYQLEVSSGKVEIKAGTPAGIFIPN